MAPNGQAGSSAADHSDLSLIDGCYLVDGTQSLPHAGGGLPAFVAHDRRNTPGRTPFMAVQTRPDAPARARVINQLLTQPPPGLLAPLAQGAARIPGGHAAWFVICQAPPGPPLWPPGAAHQEPWSEGDLLDFVLRPAAQTLDLLQEQRITHRAIRPDNLFRAGRRDGARLGAAWAAPPASLQPVIFEPPYVAQCLPSGRGDGGIADDVYALGVTLLTLATGRLPMAGLDDAEIIRRKLELGSFAALAGELRLPPVIADLVRGMLAEDPDHRPLPGLLADPAAARSRRVAARPPARAQTAIEIAGQGIWTTRTLAHVIAKSPTEGIRHLRGGAIDRWLRRGLGDPLLAVKLDEALRLRTAEPPGDEERADSLLAMRAVALLDPLAPLCWRDVTLWPDGLGTALADAKAPLRALHDIVTSEAVAAWAGIRPERCDPRVLRADAQQHHTVLRLPGWSGGMSRLRYALNPSLPCTSPLLSGHCVVRLADLLPALEAVAAQPPSTGPIDREIAGFLAARYPARIEADLQTLGASDASPLIALRLLAGLQTGMNAGAKPALATWLGNLAAPTLSAWRNRTRRERMQAALTGLMAAGHLGGMLALLDDPASRTSEAAELAQTMAEIARIDAELAQAGASGPQRRETARQIGHEIVASAGAVALTLSALAAFLT